jgi:hypothetical protein
MTTEAFYGQSGLFLEQARPPSSRHWPLDGDILAIGRDPASAVRIDDTSISRHHADLIRRGPSWFIVDARSTNGTFVNDQRVSESIVLARDRVRLGRVEFVVREPGYGLGDRRGQEATSEVTWPPLAAGGGGGPSRPAQPLGSAQPAAAGMSVYGQEAGVINNADRMQLYYIQQRESFLRDVAATKTKARWLAWTGLVIYLAGFGLFAYGDLNFIKQIVNLSQTNGEPSSIPSPFGGNVGGVPLGIIGFALGAVGAVMLIVGIVLHIVAAARRRRADRDFPLHAP